MSHEDGIVLKGQKIVVPLSLRQEMKKRLHAAHTGYDSMISILWNSIFSPGLSKEIKQLADQCETCQRHKNRNQKESLYQHDNGQMQWERVAVDLFEIQGRNYLVTVDNFSNYIEVDYLPSTTSR